jgi:hypothetical protein
MVQSSNSTDSLSSTPKPTRTRAPTTAPGRRYAFGPTTVPLPTTQGPSITVPGSSRAPWPRRRLPQTLTLDGHARVTGLPDTESSSRRISSEGAPGSSRYDALNSTKARRAAHVSYVSPGSESSPKPLTSTPSPPMVPAEDSTETADACFWHDSACCGPVAGPEHRRGFKRTV